MLHQTFHCPENWDKMQPSPNGRFCGVCQKNVFDFTNKSNEEILELLKTTGKSFCGKSSAAQLHDFNQYALHRQVRAKAALFLLGLLLVGCEPAPAQEEKKMQAPPPEEQLTTDLIADILQSIPSPLEVSQLLLELDRDKKVFKQQKLLPIKDLTTLTPDQLSFLYGQYSVNVAYAYQFKEMELVTKYRTQMEAIEQKLGLQQLIPYKDLTRLLQSKDNLDSILNLTQKTFEQISSQQRENKTEHYGLSVLLGGFIEANYLLSVFYEQLPDEKIKEKMGEQKLTLEQLYLVADIYKDKLFYYQDFLAFNKEYKKIEIIVPRKSPIIVEVNAGEMTIETEVLVKVNVSPQDFQKIREMIKALREQYVQ